MTLFEIDQRISEVLDNLVIDEETGEVTGAEELDTLSLEKDEKTKNVALYYLGLVAEGKALDEQKKKFDARLKATKAKAERLKNYLEECLHGEPFKCPEATISYRSSTAVEIDDGFVEWAKENMPGLLTYGEPTPNKTAIKELLTAGAPVSHAAIVSRQNIQIR